MNRRIGAVVGIGMLALAFGVVGATAGEGRSRPDAAGEQRAEIAFRMGDARITESSGLVASLRKSDRVWTHNDSGDSARIFAVDTTTGASTATLDLTGAPARDWEAMTACRGDDGDPALWIADIGDNIRAWKTYRLLRVREARDPQSGAAAWTRFDVRYADGKARDAEAVLCHPRTGRLYLVSKSQTADAGVWAGPASMTPGQTNVFTRVADAPRVVTDATFTADGEHAVLRGYTQAWVLDSDWQVIATFTPPGQLQSETAALTGDGKAVLFGSEGVQAAVWRVNLPEELKELDGSGEDLTDTQPTATGDSPEPTASPTPSVAATPVAGEGQAQASDPGEGIPGVDGAWVALVSAVLLAAMALFLVGRRD